ncbi:MAG: flagellar assembly protein FliH [Spirochaetes bacterium]|nr:flagellar assembly protein FliH [Spirochaetota bacterium]
MANRILRMPTGRPAPKAFKVPAPPFKSLEELRVSQEVVGETVHGPSLAEVQEEISKQRHEFEEDQRSLIRNTESEARRIIERAEAGAFQRIKTANEEHRQILEQAKREAEELVQKAKREAEGVVRAAEERKAVLDKEAYDAGFAQGLEKAFDEGKVELGRMLQRLEKILAETINKRNDIIESSEKQLVNIAILIARKVVKAITESDQAVILRNVSEALRKIKGRAQVTIRVNISDMELTTRHKDDFYRMLNNIENVNVLEDPNVEKGGCIIETDFGDVDARISAQLDEIETAIKNIQPIKGM